METKRSTSRGKRCLSLLSLLICLFCSLTLSAQNNEHEKISIQANRQPVEEVFKLISNQSKVKFFYGETVINNELTVSLNMRNTPVRTILDEITKQTGLKFNREGNTISVSSSNRPQQSISSTKKISGTVIDQSGIPVIGANVVVKGTTNGTITGLDGEFTLEVPEKSQLAVSYIGYTPKEILVGSNTVYRIELAEDNKTLDEVVVTALGIKREEKALGYAVQKVSSETFLTAKGIDIASSLSGKVAGLNIQNSTEFSEDSKILLRGQTPLLVIDGVPYDNMSLNEIAADDIASIDVLKGATASALYGARGGTGALMITTKKGEKEGLNIDVNSNTMFFSGYLAFPEVQHSYSAGTGGKYNNNAVWGDKLDIGRTAIMWDPFAYEFREQELISKGKDNYKNFLQFSWLTNNNVSVSQKGEFGSFRTSITHAYNRGQYPNQDLNKLTFMVGGDMSWNNFKLDATASYNKRIASNISGTGYSGSYIYDMVIWGGTEYDVRDYRNYWIKGLENVQQNWYDDSWYDNPYFKANEVINGYDTDIFNAAVNLTYEFSPWLKLIGRAGADVATRRDIWRNAISANYGWDKKGYFGIDRDTKLSTNADAILMFDQSWNKFNINALVGSSVYYYKSDLLESTTKGGLSIPGFYSLNASIDPVNTTSEYYQKRVNSLYGKLSLSWASTYFLDITGRNDWSSTLRSEERSYFYPSVSGSIVLSEILKLPGWWDFLKVRSSWTSTKKDASIYANNNVYSIKTNVWDGLNTAEYPTTLIGGSVRPNKSETWEAGAAFNLFENRFNLDFTYYRKMESDFIINGSASHMTGFKYIQTNSKEKRLRQGVEIIIGGTPIKTADFSWNILTNWGHDKYTYAEIDPEFSTKNRG
ncbi:SusC/RagA family TonB-linked outer membrane protein [Massilibacteroides sp.]|uniref:SusC/RagA family TonB-linked outer membrane protein n=1 Tax=Massilibacteroides sp. TaxID=2034766 RepID=UPI0026341017|nr:SusC/RagA family TonB-linked outer membrane protein [Massilibacteroides sp.]MDD4514033.1 SusC/RagA family TonB-linked outer membrane protein [Massilibacteroides sp.]